MFLLLILQNNRDAETNELEDSPIGIEEVLYVN